MNRRLVTLLLLVLMTAGCARYGQEADVATTAVGLALGMAESNPMLAHPIGMGLGMAAKGGLTVWADTQGHEVCYAAHQTINSIGWGCAVANVLTMTGVITGGLSALPIVAMVALWTAWRYDDHIRRRCRR